MRIDSKLVREALFLTILLPPVSVLAQKTMASLKGHNRVLLIFSATSGTHNFAHQQYLLKNQASELADRDIILIPVLHRWTPVDADLRQSQAPFTSGTEQKRLRSRYHIQPDEFTVILLGKDGGEKLRSHIPVTIEELSNTIDSMPMRQQELRQRARSSTQSSRE
jgi:hypothetical protein